MATNETQQSQQPALKLAAKYQELADKRIRPWPVLTIANVLRILPTNYQSYVFSLIFYGCKDKIPHSNYSDNSVSFDLSLIDKNVLSVVCAFLDDIGATYTSEI